jgi:hypothetical protein
MSGICGGGVELTGAFVIVIGLEAGGSTDLAMACSSGVLEMMAEARLTSPGLPGTDRVLERPPSGDTIG